MNDFDGDNCGRFNKAAHEACQRLGLTAEQLDAGVLEKLVEVTKEVHRLCQCQYADAKICPMRKLADALAPFQQEKP